MTSDPTGQHRRWPLLFVAVPAGLATWSGWVELGRLTGFGLVRPLPGIVDDFSLDSAIALPLGVEAYAAIAFGAYLTRRPLSKGTRRFAGLSALGSLVLGMLGQISYHLMAAAHYAKAPWEITTVVACIPVIMLGLAGVLSHMIIRDGEAVREALTDQPHDATDAGEDCTDGGWLSRTGRWILRAVRRGRTAVDVLDRTDIPHPDRTAEPEQPRTDIGAHGRTDADGRGQLRTGDRTGQVRTLTDRAAIVVGLAQEIRTAEAADQEWRPDYAGLMARTGYGRSWAEKAVRDARDAAARTDQSRTGTEGI